MKLHEYQAKQLLLDYGLPVYKCYAATYAEEATDFAQKIGGNKWAVKVQVHSGFRYKNGGVLITDNYAEVEEFSNKWLGNRFICNQEDEEINLPVNSVIVEKFINFDHAYYLSLTIDRATASIAIIASTQGGIDIETAIETNPNIAHKITVDLLVGSQPFQARYLGKKLALNDNQIDQLTEIVEKLVKLFIEKDLVVLEINPLVVRKNGKLHFLDVKIETDDNANWRQPEIRAIEDTSQKSEQEINADKYNLSYIAAKGDIGYIVNGTGLAMASIDVMRELGGEPASFLDVSGNIINEEQIIAACNITLSNTNINVVLVNIYTGISSCLVIARALIKAITSLGTNMPFVVRLLGTDEKEAAEELKHHNIKTIIIEPDLKKAIQTAVQITKN